MKQPDWFDHNSPGPMALSNNHFFPLSPFSPSSLTSLVASFSLSTFISGCVKGIREEGMPQYRHPDFRGNLYIHFDVEFPENSFQDEKGLQVSGQDDDDDAGASSCHIPCTHLQN